MPKYFIVYPRCGFVDIITVIGKLASYLQKNKDVLHNIL